MFAQFVCALLSFCAQEFPYKSKTREPGEIIVEFTSYAYIGYILVFNVVCLRTGACGLCVMLYIFRA